MKKITPFHDSAKSLAHCELCLDEIQQDNLSPWAYEFFFNSFIFYINQSWELAKQAFIKTPDTSANAQELIKQIENMREQSDPLLLYIREARNQLAHRESILWTSDEEPEKPKGLGLVINLGANYYSTSWDRYSCTVLPSLSLNFVGTEVAAKPVFTRSGNLIHVPKEHQGSPIENSPTGIMKAAYKFYGQSFSKLLQHL